MSAIVLSDLVRNSGAIRNLNLKDIESLLHELRGDKDPAVARTIGLLEERRARLMYDEMSKVTKSDPFSYIPEAVASFVAPILSQKEEFIKAFKAAYEEVFRFIAGAKANGVLQYDEARKCLSGPAGGQAMEGIYKMTSLFPGAKPRVSEVEESSERGSRDEQKRYDMVFQVPRKSKAGFDDLMNKTLRSQRVADLNALLSNLFDDFKYASPSDRVPTRISYASNGISPLLRSIIGGRAYEDFGRAVDGLRAPSPVAVKRPGERFVSDVYEVGSRGGGVIF